MCFLFSKLSSPIINIFVHIMQYVVRAEVICTCSGAASELLYRIATEVPGIEIDHDGHARRLFCGRRPCSQELNTIRTEAVAVASESRSTVGERNRL